MKLVIMAGAPSVGKTMVAKQIIRSVQEQIKISFLKIDVARAFEGEEIGKECHIPTKVIYSGDLCPDHAGVMILGDAIDWASGSGAGLLMVESAGLCLRCSPYVNQGVGIAVLSGVSGMNTPLKIGPMLSLADIAVTTKIDLISQAEREVFRERIKEVNPQIKIVETNALQGTGLQGLVRLILESGEIDKGALMLKGVPPLGTCTICIGKRDVGWEHHFGVIRKLDNADYLYRGE